MRGVRWSTSVYRLEDKRGELELDAPLKWETVVFAECVGVDRRQV